MANYPNWFEQIAQHNFATYLEEFKGKPNLKFLQLGVFTGDATVWLCNNILTSDSSKLIDVDTWQGAPNEPIQQKMEFDDVYQTYLSKVKDLPVVSVVSDTVQYLIRQIDNFTNAFDFIYVDAHHTSASALLDSELSWSLLKSGGILAIDDYEWLHPDGVEIHAPKLGIHMFLDRHLGEYEELVRNQQVWIRKK
jgi:hypothetical protein